jgi:hypothetical protein
VNKIGELNKEPKTGGKYEVEKVCLIANCYLIIDYEIGFREMWE